MMNIYPIVCFLLSQRTLKQVLQFFYGLVCLKSEVSYYPSQLLGYCGKSESKLDCSSVYGFLRHLHSVMIPGIVFFLGELLAPNLYHHQTMHD